MKHRMLQANAEFLTYASKQTKHIKLSNIKGCKTCGVPSIRFEFKISKTYKVTKHKVAKKTNIRTVPVYVEQNSKENKKRDFAPGSNLFFGASAGISRSSKNKQNGISFFLKDFHCSSSFPSLWFTHLVFFFWIQGTKKKRKKQRDE